MRNRLVKYIPFFLLMFCSRTDAGAQAGLCPSNLNFEMGDFTNWVCNTGTVATGGFVTWGPGTAPVPGRHTIITAANAGTDPFGGFPTLCPNNSAVSVKLGNATNGSQTERLSYTYTIPGTLSNFSMIFYYAVVIENPSGHIAANQPRFQAKIFDVTTGLPLNCVNFDFIAATAPGGFQLSPIPGNLGAQVFYKDWTTVSINLNAYIGKAIRLEFVTMDCAQNGHSGYAYVDVGTSCNGAILGSVCLGDLTTTLTAPFGFQSYEWYSDNTFSTVLSTTQTITFNPPPAVGSIYPLVITPFPGYGCKDTLYALIGASPKPPSDAGPDQTICVGDLVQIGVPPQPAYDYSWTPAGQVSSPISSNPMAWVSSPTTTEFIVRTTDLLTGCYSEDTTYITGRIADTSLSINGNTNYCTGDASPGILSVNNTLMAVQWYNGPTPIPGATGYTYQPTASGSYWAQVQHMGCTDSTRIIGFTIGTTPVSVAGADASICINQTVQIGGPPAAGVNYSWTPVAQVSNPAIADPQAWVYDGTPVQFIVHSTDIASGCYSEDTMYITGRVVDTSLLLTGKTVYCTGDIAAGILSVSNTLVAVQWYDGVTPIAGATGYNYQPTASGNYWAEVQQNGCTDSTRTTTFTIGITPVSFAGPDANICANQTVQIGGPPVAGVNYSWTPAAQVSNPAIADPQAWVYDGTPVRFIVHTTDVASGCYSEDTMYITGRVVDTALSLNGKKEYCIGDAAAGTLSVNPGHTAIQWYDASTPIPGATGMSYYPTVSGNYWAELQQFGCTDSTLTIQFDIHAIPIPLFTPSSDSGCVTRNVFTFTNNSNAPDGAAMSYLWKFSDGTRQTVMDAVKTFVLPGSYTVKLITTTIFGCADSTATTTVHVMPNGKADFKWDSICVNRPSLFYNLSNEKSSPQVNYSWNFNNGGPLVLVKNPGAVTYPVAGQVDVTLILTALGCENDPDSVVKKVQANVSRPGIQYKDITVPEGAKTFIHARDSIGTYFQWMPLVQLNNYNTRYTEFTAINDILYTISISDIHTCVTVDTLQMLVLKKPGYYLPTAFTPNGDGLNDVARPYLVRMKSLVSFSVFDRWGKRVFYTQQEGKGWDGRLNGEKEPSGVYVWILEFVDNNNKKVTEKGTITLIR